MLAGLAGNYVFPHFGEIARAVLAAPALDVPPSALLGSIAIERFFDFLALLVIVLVVLLPLGGIDDEIRAASFAVAGLCAVLLAGVVLFVFRTEACIGLARRMAGAVPREASATWPSITCGRPRVGLGAIGAPRLARADLRLVGRCSGSRSSAASSSACGPWTPRSRSRAPCRSLLLNVIGLTLPAAPGHVGTVQLAFIAGLAPFGVAHEERLRGLRDLQRADGRADRDPRLAGTAPGGRGAARAAPAPTPR